MKLTLQVFSHRTDLPVSELLHFRMSLYILFETACILRVRVCVSVYVCVCVFCVCACVCVSAYDKSFAKWN